MPRVKSGYVRLYRGGTEGSEGQWFSDSKEVAQFHFQNHGYDRKATLSYVDVPKDAAFEYAEAAFAHPDVLSKKTIAEAGDHVLPKEIADRATVIGKSTPKSAAGAPSAAAGAESEAVWSAILERAKGKKVSARVVEADTGVVTHGKEMPAATTIKKLRGTESALAKLMRECLGGTL